MVILSFLLWFLTVVMELNYLLKCACDMACMTLPLDRTSITYTANISSSDKLNMLNPVFPCFSNVEIHATGYIYFYHPSQNKDANFLQSIGGQRSVWVNEPLHLWVLRCSLFQVPFDGCSARYQQTIPPRRENARHCKAVRQGDGVQKCVDTFINITDTSMHV